MERSSRKFNETLTFKMKTKNFITKYLASPVIAHRKKSLEVFFSEAKLNIDFRQQLIENLTSKNYDIVFNSLKVLRSLAEYDLELITSYGQEIVALVKQTDHFGIAWLCKEISDLLHNTEVLSKADYTLIQNKVTPIFKPSEEEEHFYDRCDFSFEYKLGNQDLKYELEHICDAFRYECKKAQGKVLKYMRSLGYKEKKIYRETKPARWRNDHYGFRYETDLYYFSRNSIEIFLLWCVKNLQISEEGWRELVRYEREWDPSIPESFLITSKPDIVGNLDLSEDVTKWLKTRVKKEEVYKLIDLSSEWVPLYENSYLKHDEKAFSRHVYTCCIKKPLGKFSKKTELGIPYYRAEKSYINELPLESEKLGNLHLDNRNHEEDLDNKLIPTYGSSSEEYDEYVRMFPSPEIVKALKLRQKRNTMEYYHGRELVIKNVHWRDGFETSVGGRGEDRYELGTYGQILLIKSKFLKQYLKQNKLKLLALGDIAKRKEKRYGGYEFKRENSRYKRASLEFFE